MKTSQIINLKSWYGVTGSIRVYEDGTARLMIKHMDKTIHNKIHKSEKAARAAWYRANS